MFDNLLLAVDLTSTEGNEKTAAAAASMAKSNDAMVHVLTVVPDTGMAIVGASLPADHMSKMLEAARTELKQWANETLPADVKRKIHVAEGTVYDQILKSAQALDIDAIIIGAHRPEFRDYLMGPNAARVARHASQSVFVVR